LSEKRNFDWFERYLQKSENIMMERPEWYSLKAENRKIEGHPKINVRWWDLARNREQGDIQYSTEQAPSG
jgi:hypothetical protein